MTENKPPNGEVRSLADSRDESRRWLARRENQILKSERSMKNNQHLSHTIETLADLDAWIGPQVELSPMQRRSTPLAIHRTADLSGQLSERVDASASTILEFFARVDLANCRLRPQPLA